MITGIVLVLMVIIMLSVGLVMCWLVLVGFYPLDENQPLNPIGITPHYIMEYCNVFMVLKCIFGRFDSLLFLNMLSIKADIPFSLSVCNVAYLIVMIDN